MQCVRFMLILSVSDIAAEVLNSAEIVDHIRVSTILEISLNLYGPGNFRVKCWWSTTLVSSHKTGYWSTYLRNWSPFFIALMLRPHVVHDERWLELIITCSTKCSRFDTLHSRTKQCKHALDFSWNFSCNLLEISWKFVQLNLYTPWLTQSSLLHKTVSDSRVNGWAWSKCKDR